jgi:hypothetical protein
MSKTTSTAPVNFLDIDYSKFSFTEVKLNKYNAKYVNILYNGAIPKFIFPKMKSPFGISKFTDPVSGKCTFLLETSLDNKNTEVRDDLKRLLEQSVKFDAFILASVQKHHNEWLKLKTKPSMEILKSQYNPMVKIPVDKETGDELEYSYRLKSKIYQTMKSDELSFSLFDRAGQKLNINIHNCEELIPKGSNVITLKRINKIWFMNKTFGVSCDLEQARVFTEGNTLSECVLLSDNEDDSEGEAVEEEEISDEEEED